MFDIEGISEYWEAIRILALLRLDEISKDEEKLRIEFLLLQKYKTVFDEIISGKSISDLEELENEIDKILSGDQFTLDIDYWDFLLMMVKKKRSLMSLSIFFKEFKTSQNEKLHYKDFYGEDASNMMSNLLIIRQENEISIPFEVNSSESCDDEMNLSEFKEKLAIERTNTIDAIFSDFVTDLVHDHVKDERTASKLVKYVISNASETKKDELVNYSTIGNENEDFKDFNVHSLLHANKNKVKEENELGWMEEFKPRKPHYFNRVKLGYEWNKINQAHYTVDNPPPREVFGYKFNIFYPNLLDTSKVPSFKLVPTESPELIVITFTGGPPYEEISFKIVNKQWDMADRKNFKCFFDRGVLSLYFDFVKLRHRR